MRVRYLCALGSALAVLVAPLTIGSGTVADAKTPSHSANCGSWMDTHQSPAVRANELVSRMSFAQKLSMVDEAMPSAQGNVAIGYVPGIPRLCIPALNLNDGGSGLADSQINSTSFPAEINQAATWDTKLEHKLGVALGTQANQKGVNVLLGPDLNLTRTPLGGRTSEEYGEDPYLAGEIGDAFINGVQSQHVIATAKQFVANDQEVNRASVNEIIDERVLKEIYEAPFVSAITHAHVGALMCAYNQVNGAYGCENPLLFDDIERGEGFRGFIVTDWSAAHSTIASANKGLDLEMNLGPVPDPHSLFTAPLRLEETLELADDWYGIPLATAITDGQLSVSILNDMVRRILHAMFSTGAFDHPSPGQPAAYYRNVDTTANKNIALSVAESSIVLLQNKSNVLPITGTGKRVAVIGLDAGAAATFVSQAASSARTIHPDVVTPLNAIGERAANSGDSVVYNPGISPSRAAAVAKTANVAVVYVGYTEGEGRDQPDLGYNNVDCDPGCVTEPSNANAVIDAVAAVNHHTIVVLNTGGPAVMPWLDRVQGVLEAWYPGEEDGAAAAAVLFGDVDPSGKLPVTFPTSLAQVPTQSVSQYPGVDGTMSYSEGLLIGYRWYNAENLTPMFPFGFGLSYTTFGLGGLSMYSFSSGVHVSAVLSNTGRRTGSDVVQVYVSDPASTGEPPQQLVAFAKRSVAPGDREVVSFTLPLHSFSYWNDPTNRWTLAPGCYTIRVGDSSTNEPLSGAVPLGGATSC
jgi:beta-glucosidase